MISYKKDWQIVLRVDRERYYQWTDKYYEWTEEWTDKF